MRLDPIVIGEYDPSWPARFAAQRDAVTGVLAPWLVHDVEHMGSTAVPGLAAKDIVDMLAVVTDIEAARAAIAPMAEIGWAHAPEPADEAERRLSFCFPSAARRSHHLHVVEAEPDDWRGWLAFRDHLRAHPDVAREYAALKRTLAAEHGDDPNRRDDYRVGKASFIVDVTARSAARHALIPAASAYIGRSPRTVRSHRDRVDEGREAVVTTLPLHGVRVIDLTTVVAGPYATQLLADLGADVVKVESPGGDVARDLGPRVHDGMAAVFLNCNRGKRSVVLDLADAGSRAVLKRLTDRADVFVHNLRPDSARRCGADADTLRAGHPELVHCAIRGFGSSGRYRDLPAYDDIVQAASGVAGQQEWTAGAPSYVVSAVGDKVSGMTAALAITAALHGRAQSGEGSTIEVPMAESLAAFGMIEHLWGRTFVPPRGDARYPRMSSVLRRPFATADGYISVVVYSNQNWDRFFEMVERRDLASDPRFATLAGRTEHLDELYTLVGEHITKATTAEWFERLTAAGIPAVPYNRVDDLFDDPHLADVGFWQEVDHPTEGTLLQVATPVTFDGERLPLGAPAPALGADTDAVLRDLR